MSSLEPSCFSPNDFVWQGLTITEQAAKRINQLIEKEPGATGLRLGIKPSGCAGWGYLIDIVHQPSKDDLCFTKHDAVLYVPLQAMPYVDGTEVDYVREGLNQIFKFNNPKAQHACGCGESFGVE